MRFARLLFVLSAASASSAFAGNVLVVGPLPTQIAEIQAAVDAAIDGDVILVKSGTYATFSVPNKTVTIVADTGQTVNIDGAIRVRNLETGRTVVISGLRADGRATADNSVTGNGFFATNCAGSIRVQDCQLQGYVGLGSSLPCPMLQRSGAELHSCADVAFVRSMFRGSQYLDLYASQPGQSEASRMGPGLWSNQSSIALYESTLRGGYGGTLCNGYPDGVDGGHGWVSQSTQLFGARTQFIGADGEDANGVSIYAGWGGHGLVRYSPAAPARLLECTLQGGDGGENWGCGFCGYCCMGEDGMPHAGGAPEVLSGTARILAGSTIAREETQLALTVTGPPGDFASVGIRAATGFVWSAPQFGVQLLSPPPRQTMILGTIPASGVLTTTIPMPSIPSTDPGRTYHMQLITNGSTGAPRLGSPLSIAVVDAAY